MTNTAPKPPVAERRQHAVTNHGITRQDPYHWLRADNWQQVMQEPETLPADIRGYIEAENAYFAEAFETPHEALTETIYREIRGRIKEDESGIPSADGAWAYNSRMEEGRQYPILVRTPRDGGEEQILLDCNAEAGDDYFGFGGGDHDPSHRWLAWSADRQGSEYYTLHIRDMETGKDTGEVLEDIAGGGVWSADSKAIYYSEYDDNHRPFRVRRHIVGTPQSEDEIVYEEKDPGFFVGVDETLNRKYIVIDAHDHQTSEFWLIDAVNGGATASSTSSPMPRAPRTSRSSPPPPRIRPPRTGSTSCRIGRASWSSISSCFSTTSCASSASRACRASSCATSTMAKSGR